MVDLKIRDFVIDNISAVLFDKDGTLIDVHTWWGEIVRRRAWALVSAYNLLNEDAEPLMYAMGLRKGGKLAPEGPVGLVGRKEVIWAVRNHLRTWHEVIASNEGIGEIFNNVHAEFQKGSAAYMKALPGACDLMCRLHEQGVKIAIVTNDSVGATKEVLEVLGVAHTVDCIIGQDNMGSAKDTGGPARQALEALGVFFNEAVVIGDAPIDIKMAMNCPVAAGIAVATGQTSSKELERYTPFIVSSLTEIELMKGGKKIG